MTTETTQSWQLAKALEDIRYRARKAEASIALRITPIENAKTALADTPGLLDALEAVLTLHQQVGKTVWCTSSSGRDLWPSPTYKAIAGALTGKDRDDG